MKAPLVLLTALFIASAHQTLSGETSGDWTYSVLDSQATITGYSGAGGAVDIPAVVNEISVVKVGDVASHLRPSQLHRDQRNHPRQRYEYWG